MNDFHRPIYSLYSDYLFVLFYDALKSKYIVVMFDLSFQISKYDSLWGSWYLDNVDDFEFDARDYLKMHTI